MNYLNQISKVGAIPNQNFNEKMLLNGQGPLSTKSAKNNGVNSFGISQSSSTTAANGRTKITQAAFGLNQ